MRSDLFGSPVSLSNAASLDAWNATCLAFLAHGSRTPEHLGRLMEAEPAFALGHAVKGLFCILLGRREMITAARASAEVAQACEDADFRTRQFLSALDAMLAREPRAAIAALEEVLMKDPRDSLAMKLSHGIRFLIGDAAGMRRSVERVLGAHGEDHPARGYILGCYAFALEETGDYARAERVGLSGLTYAVDDAWGLHAVAHVHDMTARAAEGIALIERHEPVWAGSNNFRFHVWWHKALLHLDRRETDIALSLYDAKIRSDKTDDYRDIANATSLLMRLSLEGVDVGHRWEELANLAENRVADGCLVFADLHYMLALIGGDRSRAQAELTQQLAMQAKGKDPVAAIAADPGKTAMSGLTSFGEGQYGEAFCHLEAVRPQLASIGGSHAQRDVFDWILVEAGLRSGQLDRTEQILRERGIQRGGRTDSFALSRFERLAELRRTALSVPAQ